MAGHPIARYSFPSDEQRRQSLQELEGQDWGEPTFPSSLVRTCYALRRKPLRDFTIENLRIMIGQNMSLNYLIPLALEHLQQDPLAAGDFYPGDLLANVLKVQADFWQTHADLRQAVEKIVERLQSFPEESKRREHEMPDANGRLYPKEEKVMREHLAAQGIFEYEIIETTPEGGPLPGYEPDDKIEEFSGMLVTIDAAYAFWLAWVDGHYTIGEEDTEYHTFAKLTVEGLHPLTLREIHEGQNRLRQRLGLPPVDAPML